MEVCQCLVHPNVYTFDKSGRNRHILFHFQNNYNPYISCKRVVWMCDYWYFKNEHKVCCRRYTPDF